MVGKLPWGFANTSNGPTALDAWEAVVWGDKTYCVFVLATPVGTNWTSVAGFIKAVFRWQAPPTQTINISAIEASTQYDPTASFSTLTYTGMAGAGSKFLAGNVTATNFMAGELAFVTATTNNRTVQVDFSSWVMDSTGNGLVLANVTATTPQPMYAEAVYYAVQNADGTVGINSWFPDAVSAPAGITDTNRTIEGQYQSWLGL
jgi:hypothetical protein